MGFVRARVWLAARCGLRAIRVLIIQCKARPVLLTKCNFLPVAWGILWDIPAVSQIETLWVEHPMAIVRQCVIIRS